MRILAILAEEEYANGLAAYVRKHKEYGFSPIVFTGPESYMKFVKEEGDSVLLVDEGYEADIPESIPREQVCLLVKDKDVNKGIYKYRSAEAIIRDISERLSANAHTEESPEHHDESERVIKGQIRTVFSPEDVFMGSSFALEATYNAGIAGNILLVSFDPFFDPGERGYHRNDMSLSDLIFLLREGKAGEGIIAETLGSGDERINILSGVNSWTDIYDMTQDDMRRLLEHVRSMNRYDLVIVDMSVLGAPALVLMEESSVIQIVSGDCGGSSARTEEWKRHMKNIGREDLLTKVEMQKEGESDYRQRNQKRAVQESDDDRLGVWLRRG